MSTTEFSGTNASSANDQNPQTQNRQRNHWRWAAWALIGVGCVLSADAISGIIKFRMTAQDIFQPYVAATERGECRRSILLDNIKHPYDVPTLLGLFKPIMSLISRDPLKGTMTIKSIRINDGVTIIPDGYGRNPPSLTIVAESTTMNDKEWTATNPHPSEAC